ncbi:MAG: methyltransferase [Clostridia bacterium]|nr:methyltransferase [Clostridia bacterium]
MVSRAERTEDLAKNLKIFVSEAHIFTSDAIILADFCAPRHKDKCCDLGTGNGIIPLLWLRDFQPKEIVGVELSESAIRLLNKTLKLNSIIGKITPVHCDLRELKGVLPNEYYDIVSINPPYKKLGTGIVNEGEDYKNARHEFTCTLEDAACAASKLLKFGGRFCICQRPERLPDIFEAMRKFKIEPKSMREVIQRVGKEPSLVLIEGKKGSSPGFRINPPLILEDENGNYTPEADKLFNSYKYKELLHNEI